MNGCMGSIQPFNASRSLKCQRTKQRETKNIMNEAIASYNKRRPNRKDAEQSLHTEKHTRIDRQTDRQIDRQTDKKTADGQTDRDIQTDRETDK